LNILTSFLKNEGLYKIDAIEPYNKGKNIFIDQLGFYLAGLLEGDGYISKPNNLKSFRPRIVFTFHIQNISMFIYLQFLLGGAGRMVTEYPLTNTSRYILSDNSSIIKLIFLIQNKLRTPKNNTLNKLIAYFSLKLDDLGGSYLVEKSVIDISDLNSNAWFSGFVEADGSFSVRVYEFTPKKENTRRSYSASVRMRFNITQRAYDIPTESSMMDIMLKIATFLNTKLIEQSSNKADISKKALVVEVTAITNLQILVNYFNKYPLLGVKALDFKDWEKVYFMIKNKEHLSVEGRKKISLIKKGMNSQRILNMDLMDISK
jgi:hypothetical protein